jgi:RNA polymerase sigma factor (sigma-70 family)
MTKLTELIIEYKKTKDKILSEKIYIELRFIVEKKAKYIFEQKYYPISLYHKSEKNGCFNLRKHNLCEYFDVENDLWIEIFRIIENYDITKEFENYLYSSLKNWTPSFINKNFVDSLANNSLNYVRNEEEQLIEIEDDNGKNITEQNSNLEEIFAICNTDRERKILSIILGEKGITQKEIAKKIGISQPAVNKILRGLKKKIK